MLMMAPATQPPLANLYLSLVFGVGQVIIGAAMALFATRKRRWQKMTLALLAFIGIWFACSGITELVVSGAELLARTSQRLSPAAAVHIRAQADLAFLIASILLLGLGAGYLLLARRWPRRQTPQASEQPSGAAGAENEETSKAEAER